MAHPEPPHPAPADPAAGPAPAPDRAALLQAALADHSAGRAAHAERGYRALLGLDPADAEAMHLLGLLLHQAHDGSRDAEAESLIRQSLALSPDRPHVYSNLAGILGRRGKPQEALAHAREAVRLAPDLPEAHNNVGVSLEAIGQLAEAEAAFRRALQLRPTYAEAHHHLANALRKQGRIDESADACRRAVRQRPDYAEAWVALSVAVLEQGMAREATDCMRRAAELTNAWRDAHPGAATPAATATPAGDTPAPAPAPSPSPAEPRVDAAGAGSSVLYTLHYLPDRHPPDLGREHAAWAARHAEPLTAAAPPHENDPDPNRRLRVGYVSPDFRDHTVPRFFEQAFHHRDRQNFEAWCYSDVTRPDAATARIKASADVWRETFTLSHTHLAELVRRDRIDILIDLRGHGADNRLLAFARKPAPIQGVTVGYFDTTGLSAIDFRVTDAWQDPFGCTAAFGTEALLRLPGGCWCYRPDDDAPPVAPLPALARGTNNANATTSNTAHPPITFGSLNKLAKVTEPCARAWAAVLSAVPGSRLVLSAPGGESARAARERLVSFGIPDQHLHLVDKAPTRGGYLARFATIDIALDPFPFNGITTTCDGLWMGVPAVTLAGDTSVGRAGLSILTAAGLGDWAAETPAGYVERAARAAADPPALSRLRSSLRQQVAASPLTDGRRQAAELEQGYRRIWQAWCARRTAGGA